MAPITEPTLLPPFVLPPGTPLCAIGGFCTGAGLGNVLVVSGGDCDELAGGGTIPAPHPWLHVANRSVFAIRGYGQTFTQSTPHLHPRQKTHLMPGPFLPRD